MTSDIIFKLLTDKLGKGNYTIKDFARDVLQHADVLEEEHFIRAIKLIERAL